MTIEKTLSPIQRYYQIYPEERDMAESYQHRDLTDYLKNLLRWYYIGQDVTVTANLIIHDKTYYTAPDVAIIKGVSPTVTQLQYLTGWEINPPNRPAPSVVFEILSKEYDKDVNPTKNRATYGALGVQEYFVYDPLGYWDSEVKLRGWQYQNQKPQELTPDAQGRIWSASLDSYLVPGGGWLYLTDANGQRRLTEGETDKTQLNDLLAKLREKGIDPDTL